MSQFIQFFFFSLYQPAVRAVQPNPPAERVSPEKGGRKGTRLARIKGFAGGLVLHPLFVQKRLTDTRKAHLNINMLANNTTLAASQLANPTVVVKVRQGEDIRRFGFTGGSNFQSLVSVIKQLFAVPESTTIR
jgi:hypothetical protein